MAKYVLTICDQTMVIDSETLDPGELLRLKSLNSCTHVSLVRTPEDRIPDMDHDALDDIAKEIVSKHGQGQNYDQAKQRVISRGLR